MESLLSKGVSGDCFFFLTQTILAHDGKGSPGSKSNHCFLEASSDRLFGLHPWSVGEVLSVPWLTLPCAPLAGT